MTCAPSAANAVAMARPMLLVAPVTSAVLCSSRVLICASLRGWRRRSATGIEGEVVSIWRSASSDKGDDSERAGGRDRARDQQHRVDAVHVRDGERLAGGDRGGGARLDECSERRDPGGDAELAGGGVGAGGPTALARRDPGGGGGRHPRGGPARARAPDPPP